METKRKSLFHVIKSNFQKYSMYYFLIIIMLSFQLLTNGTLLKPLNMTNIILQNSYILVLAIGMIMLIVLGNIDLSVGSITAFTGALAAVFIIRFNWPVLLTMVVCLLIGGLIGGFHGFWVAYVKVPAFIATLAGMLVFRGLTIVILEGKSIAPFPRLFQLISSGFLLDYQQGGDYHGTTLVIGGLLGGLLLWKLIKKRQKALAYGYQQEPLKWFISKLVSYLGVLAWYTYLMATYEGFPNVLIVLVTLILAYHFVTTRTTIGRGLYATGGNLLAAELSGIKTKKLIFWSFVNMGMLSAVAGLIFSARLNAATPTAGNGFELDAIAACYIGGASAYGGVGTVLGAIVGGLVMGVLNNGMSLMGIGVDWQQAIKGLVLLFAVAFDIYNKNKGN